MGAASKSGDLPAVRELLSRASDGVSRPLNKSSATALHVAAQHGRRQIVEELLSRGADADAKALDGWRPLHMSAAGGHEGVVALLLGMGGADVDATEEEGWAPLHVAAENDQFDVAITLLRAGGGVDVAREDGATPLHVAAGNGFADMVTLLLRKGAAMEAQTKDGWTALHMSYVLRARRLDGRGTVGFLFGALSLAGRDHRVAPWESGPRACSIVLVAHWEWALADGLASHPCCPSCLSVTWCLDPHRLVASRSVSYCFLSPSLFPLEAVAMATWPRPSSFCARGLRLTLQRRQGGRYVFARGAFW